ncbi:MAG: hypothetical protein JWO58_2534 [Chitinophagaceae bacterium]|nr:hypothetical protein [Chitinophagaceae bacterium]
MLRLFTISILLLNIATLYSCNSSKELYVASDPLKNFNDYKTFCWVIRRHNLDSIKNINVKYVEATIRHEVNRELTKHGLSYSDTLNADISVDFILLVKENNFHSVYELQEQKKDLDMSLLKPQKYFNGKSFQGVKNPNTAPISENIKVERDDKTEEETLIILIKDKKDNQIVWKGQCTKTLIEGEDFSTELPSAIRKMFKYFPKAKHRNAEDSQR